MRNLPPRLAPLDTRIAKAPPKTADSFYVSTAWRALMARIIRERGRRCEAPDCQSPGAAPSRIFGDHIIELRDGGAPLAPGNVRLLCGACHTAKTIRARAARQAVDPWG